MESSRCKAFLAAADLGSFTKAAESLSYTPSGVSQLVSALEKELGFALFTRYKKGVVLTDAGKEILPAIRSFLQQEERIFQTAADIRGLSIGQITIASYPSMSARWLPRVIREFQEDYPNIQIRLLEGIRQEITEWLDDSSADIGFMSWMEDLSFDFIPLAKDKMIAVLPKDHPLANADVYPLARCREEDFIMPANGRDDDVALLLERNNIEPHITYTTMENPAAISMIENGLGMSVMNERSTLNWSSDVAKLPLDPPGDIILGMAIPSLERSSPAVRKFTEYAKRILMHEEYTPV